MDSVTGTDSLDSDDLIPGVSLSELDAAKIQMPRDSYPSTSGIGKVSSKGIENAKKRLRAFSIQKKTSIPAKIIPKPVSTGSATVLIGKLSSVKTTPKPEAEPDQKKPPKPPKPGDAKNLQDSYTMLRTRTRSEIEDMKRKMELVELGIPLGLICPSATSEKGMPTKAMPPIKSFLDPVIVDKIIHEAKKARTEGKEFKFDYRKYLPDYDNPFQLKKEDEKEEIDKRKNMKEERRYEIPQKKKYSNKRIMQDSKHPRRRYSDDRYLYNESLKREWKEIDTKTSSTIETKETKVNLRDYLICDSWPLDNEDKGASPNKINILKKLMESNLQEGNKKEKLKPVIDSFEFEIDPLEDAPITLQNDSEAGKSCKPQTENDSVSDPTTDLKLFDQDEDMSKEGVIDANDDNFLESVINEIRQEHMNEDSSHDKGLVEYDLSPKEDDEDCKFESSHGSVTPELNDKMRDLQSSQQSHYSDGYRSIESFKSVESGYKSTESGYKSTDSYKSSEIYTDKSTDSFKSLKTPEMYKSTQSYKGDINYKSKHTRRRSRSHSPHKSSSTYMSSIEKEMTEPIVQMSKSTVDSLETWSFVLKICQPLLFRHDRNKCFKETQGAPKVWYTVNPKTCKCVKDRSVVYQELEMCKMVLVDRVYGCDQISDSPSMAARGWYPQNWEEMIPARAPQPATDWETDDPPVRSTTPQPDEISLDHEYQRFMQAVWPEAGEPPKPNTPRSTTPVKQERRKQKKGEDSERSTEDKKKSKKIKLSSEGWSQESDLEDEVQKPKKMKADKEKNRKRKHSVSSTESATEEDTSKKKKQMKKENKKSKSKLAKRRRVNQKKKKKLKEKLKKKQSKLLNISDESDDDNEQKKTKKAKKKSQQKSKKSQKKRKQKAKSLSSSSLSSDSSRSSELESDEHIRKKKSKKKYVAIKKKKDKKKKRKESSGSAQSEELFDENVLINIKTERLTDDEKNQQMNDFSPRRQKPREREIINVKELQNDFVGKNILIKQEKVETLSTDQEEENVETASTDQCEADNIKTVEIKETTTDNVGVEVEFKDSPEFVSSQLSQSSPDITLPMDPKPESPTEHICIKASPVSEDASDSQNGFESHIISEPHTIPIPQSSDETVGEPPQAEARDYVDSSASRNPQTSNKTIEEELPETVKQEVRAVESLAGDYVDSSVSRNPQTSNKTIEEELPETVKQEVRAVESLARDYVDSSVSRNPRTSNKTIEEELAETVKQEIRAVETLARDYVDSRASRNEFYGKSEMEVDEKFHASYGQDNYEIYEQMAMAYQSNVANQSAWSAGVSTAAEGRSSGQRIETVVRRRGEIKCDWRAGDVDSPAAPPQARPSRWGLKPGEVNIVLTGGGYHATGANATTNATPVASAPSEQYPIRSVVDPVYKIETVSSRNDSNNSSIGYDEAYLDTYGAADRLQYGDCFAAVQPAPLPDVKSLDERIDRVLRESALGNVAKDPDDKEAEKDSPEKGILVTKAPVLEIVRPSKSVSFADGYKPGQDSDVEDPPTRKKKKSRRYGCAWPCPADHPDHVPLWDALPPPPPPPDPPVPTPAVPRLPLPHPIHLAMQNPLQNPMQNPMQNPLQNPLQNPMQNPLQNPMQSTLHNPLQNPMQNPLQNPMQNPLQNPMQSTLHNPLQNPMQNPLQNPMQRTLHNPLQNPMQNLQGLQHQQFPMQQLHMMRPPMMQPQQRKFDPSKSMPAFMPPEPPPGLITFPQSLTDVL